ncbi:MAG: hypothetical protein DMD79_24495 [Candidatus Rokuibacteriota bacterium]|nr:MAG: hypothetical protein DMD79_24495 [Candidatus Rokubacteria bacterium]
MRTLALARTHGAPPVSDSAQAAGTGGGGRVVLAVGVAAVTALVFAPSLRNGFVEWDDTGLLVDNAAYRGLGWNQLRWMATFGIDSVLWGMWPAGYHLTNVLLHSANVMLVFVIAVWFLSKATSLPPRARRMGAVAAALLFALHPLRVEAVTWVTGRLDVLSGFWFLVMILTYLRASEAEGRPRQRWLLGSLAALTLGLLSKPVVMAAPLVLIILDVYPLRRLLGDPRQWTSSAAREVWREKLPFGALGLAGAVVSYYSQARRAGLTVLDLPAWLGTVLFTLWFHVEKTLAPVGLSPLYELPVRINPYEGQFAVAGVGVLAISLALVVLRGAWPTGLAAWLSYAVLLAPVSGFVHAGPQVTADRYSYLPGLAWAIVVGAGVGWLVHRRAWAWVGVGAVGLAVLGALTLRQQAVWRDTGRLWEHAARVTPDCAECRVNFGNWLHAHGREAEAIAEYGASLALRPDRVGVHTNVGLVLVRLGRVAEALPHYEQALARHPDWLGVRLSLASALISLGRRPEAVARLGEATRIGSPVTLVEALRMQGAARPADPAPRLGLVQVYLAAGDRAQAAVELRALERLDPDLARLVAPGTR